MGWWPIFRKQGETYVSNDALMRWFCLSRRADVLRPAHFSAMQETTRIRARVWRSPTLCRSELSSLGADEGNMAYF